MAYSLTARRYEPGKSADFSRMKEKAQTLFVADA